MKVLINNCYGGFGFSQDFVEHIRQFPGYEHTNSAYYDLSRDNQFVVEEAIKYGLDKASGGYSQLVVEEIPDGCNYIIGEYDGHEHISDVYITVTYDELKNGLSMDKLKLIADHRLSIRVK